MQARPTRGSRISSFYPVKSLPSLSSLDSAFQLQEYISLLIRLDVHDVETITSLPNPDSGNIVDESCWIYEQLRRLAQDLSHPLITMLQVDCTRQSCNEMKAGEWLYLCVAHGNDGAMERCCAIDYILHTLDSATALLNSPRAFPSRLQIPPSSRRHFGSLARRLGRIFAHAYFHHRELFEQAEAESSLYARFLRLVEVFSLVPKEFLVIPAPSSSVDGESRGDGPKEDHPEPKLGGAALDATTEPYFTAENSSPPTSDSPPLNGSQSPRKPTGRSRTDTMVYSDASALIEDLASRSPSSDAINPLEKEALEEKEPVHPIDSARKAVLELDIVPASNAPPPAIPGEPEQPTSNAELLAEDTVDLSEPDSADSGVLPVNHDGQAVQTETLPTPAPPSPPKEPSPELESSEATPASTVTEPSSATTETETAPLETANADPAPSPPAPLAAPEVEASTEPSAPEDAPSTPADQPVEEASEPLPEATTAVNDDSVDAASFVKSIEEPDAPSNATAAATGSTEEEVKSSES
ncbi:Mob1/phocein [Flagelloscypha sp. PMI_526]|nr:Mob1/phocein [Flagelloscypha sp. PMI_526]